MLRKLLSINNSSDFKNYSITSTINAIKIIPVKTVQAMSEITGQT